LEGHDLHFVHCVSSEPTLLIPMAVILQFWMPWDSHQFFGQFAYQKNRYFNCLFISKSWWNIRRSQ
jgi:hypothetical protein